MKSMNVRYPKTTSMQNRYRGLSGMFREYCLEGCELSVKGRYVEPWQAADLCLREPSGYMMDFIPDEDNDRIIRIDLVPLGDKEPDIPRERYIGWCS